MSVRHLCCHNRNCYRAALDRVYAFRDSRAIIDVRLSLGFLMYRRNVALFHLPSIIIIKSSRPACAAAVAAPILKLCLANCTCGWPSSRRASLTMLTNHVIVSRVPSGYKKNGPGDDPLCAMNAHTAVMGRSVSPIRPTTTPIPFPNWSVLDRLRCTVEPPN